MLLFTDLILFSLSLNKCHSCFLQFFILTANLLLLVSLLFLFQQILQLFLFISLTNITADLLYLLGSLIELMAIMTSHSQYLVVIFGNQIYLAILEKDLNMPKVFITLGTPILFKYFLFFELEDMA
jgi:hypothetical protein